MSNMSSRSRNVWLPCSLLKVVVLLFSAALVCSDKIIGSLGSVKLSENVTYDCVDIYKQPSLKHHLLKTHKIQMKPSFSRSELKDQVGNKAHKKKIKCPDGTVPILRNTEEYISNTKRIEEMHFNPLTDSPGNTQMSGVRSSSGGPYHGVEGWFNGFELKIAKDQASYAFIYVGTKTNFIQAGWMVNPGVFGDERVWSYGFWRGKNVEGCYNVNCPGFVQVAKDDPIGYPSPLGSDIGWYHYSINQDKRTGNWWLIELNKDKPNVDIGYWPKELFDFMRDGAENVGAGGAVQASQSGSCPPMGNGKRPGIFPKRSAMFTNVGVVDSNYHLRRIDHTPMYRTLQGKKCYGIEYGTEGIVIGIGPSHLGFWFNYGGPGGKWC